MVYDVTTNQKDVKGGHQLKLSIHDCNDSTYMFISVNIVCSCQYMSVHVSTCLFMSVYVCSYQYMSLHVSTCNDMSTNNYYLICNATFQRIPAKMSNCINPTRNPLPMVSIRSHDKKMIAFWGIPNSTSSVVKNAENFSTKALDIKVVLFTL